MRILLLIALLFSFAPSLFADETDIRYSIRRQIDVGEGRIQEFTDAIYFTQDEWAHITQEEIDARVKERMDNYAESIKNPPPVVEPTEEQLENEKLYLESQLQEVTTKLTTIKTVKGGKITNEEVIAG